VAAAAAAAYVRVAQAAWLWPPLTDERTFARLADRRSDRRRPSSPYAASPQAAMPLPPTKDIWSRSFLHDGGDGEAGSSSDEDVLGPDAVTMDAGELERQQVEQLDLSARDEGGLVVKYNPWYALSIRRSSHPDRRPDSSRRCRSAGRRRKWPPVAETVSTRRR
jgi:hypothetical protein